MIALTDDKNHTYFKCKTMSRTRIVDLLRDFEHIISPAFFTWKNDSLSTSLNTLRICWLIPWRCQAHLDPLIITCWSVDLFDEVIPYWRRLRICKAQTTIYVTFPISVVILKGIIFANTGTNRVSFLTSITKLFEVQGYKKTDHNRRIFCGNIFIKKWTVLNQSWK